MLIETFSFLTFGVVNYLAYCKGIDSNVFIGTLLMCFVSFIIFARLFLVISSNSLLNVKSRSIKIIYLYAYFTVLQIIYLLLFTQFFYGLELFYRVKELNNVIKSLVVVVNVVLLFFLKKYKFSIKSLICKPYIYLEILDVLLILSNLILSILIYNNLVSSQVVPIIYVLIFSLIIVNAIEALRRQYWIYSRVYYYKLAKVVKSSSSLSTLINPPKVNLLENSLFRDLSNLLDASFIRSIEYLKVLKTFRNLLEASGKEILEVNQLVCDYSKLILQNLMRRSLDFDIWPTRYLDLLQKLRENNRKKNLTKGGD